MIYDFPNTMQWGELLIKDAWNNFAGDDYGVIITLDDASRRHWFVNPVGLPDDLQQFLGPARTFQRWMYLPVDSTGPNGQTLSTAGRDCVARYDRVLAASEWGKNVLVAGGRQDADWLPHGYIETQFNIVKGDWPKPGIVRVGCVMANQSRKDYPAAFECFASLRHEYGNRLQAWVHTNEVIGYWNLAALTADFGLEGCINVTTSLSDSDLAAHYSSCDCTVLPTGGEGFGFPILESLACGTPCITTNYAGGAELIEESCRVDPIAYRVDTQHNVLRAVLSGYAFALKAKEQIEKKRGDWEYHSHRLAAGVSHLRWHRLKHLWEKWLLGGLK
jgi:glycosyltransferase involved in cell wall biosynthesis